MFRPSIQRTSFPVVKSSSTPQHHICDDALCEETQNYRKRLDHYLECIGKDWDMDLRLNHKGICFFQYEHFVIVVEAPKQSASFFVYTCVLRCTSTSTAVMKRALEMNYLTQETCGCTLGLDASCEDDNALEVTLSYSQPIMGLNRGELCNIVMNFMESASYIHSQLAGVESQVEAHCEQPKHTFTQALNEEEPKARAPFQPPPHHTASETSTPKNEAVTPITSNKSFGLEPHDRARQVRFSVVRHLNPKLALAKQPSLQKTFTKMTLALGRSTSKVPTKKKVPKKVTFEAQEDDASKVIKPDTNTFKVVKPETKRHSSCSQMNKRVASMDVSRPGLPRRVSVRPVLTLES
jgi:hypothetical protein